MKIKTTRCWNCHVHTTHVDDEDNENIGCPNCGRMLYPSKPKPGVTRHSVALGYFGDYKARSWTDAIVGDITSPKVLAEMLADAKAERKEKERGNNADKR